MGSRGQAKLRAKSIAHFAADKDVLGASFFCSRDVAKLHSWQFHNIYM